ncbi:hypothetical protein [Nocardiopsis ganjiahuensis]|uniref:hypothetical protein n=1 Tax=Nocardiopsis ganjiahuensis TaxID=239984 RepID=UPI00034DF22E|nr:hypothetical protein [Nocardiopsis ganjiahuensis]
MPLHSAGRPEDLPPPSVLWARSGTLAALEAGSNRDGGPTRLEGPALVHDDRGGAEWRLVRCGADRALLVGYDNDFSDSPRSDRRPVDLFAQGPDWLPWGWIADLERRLHNIGYVYWWEDGRWARGPYPDDWQDDGTRFGGTSWVEVGVDEFVERLLDGYPPEEEVCGDWPAPVRSLLTAAVEGAVGEPAVAGVARVLDRVNRTRREELDLEDDEEDEDEVTLDPAAVVAHAARYGLTPGTRRPGLAPGSGRPPRPSRPVVSEEEWALLVGHEMRRARERERPAVPETEELRQLVAWVRANALDGAGAAVLVDGHTDPRLLTTASGERYVDRDGSLLRLLAPVREAEADRHGQRWLYLRLTVTADGHSAERAYDHWPSWAPGEEVSLHQSLFRLRTEYTRIVPERRPGWAGLLEETTRERPPAPTPVREPSLPLEPLGAEDREELLGKVLDRLPRVGDRYREVVLEASYLAGYRRVRVVATTADGERRGLWPHHQIPPLLGRLRAGSYEPDRGTWFGFRMALTGDGRGVEYDAGEPAFESDPTDWSFALDQVYYPRSAEHTPPWLRARLERARERG